jgi:ABC-type multidrug transport system fused ATPase/permease subunit
MKLLTCWLQTVEEFRRCGCKDVFYEVLAHKWRREKHLFHSELYQPFLLLPHLKLVETIFVKLSWFFLIQLRLPLCHSAYTIYTQSMPIGICIICKEQRSMNDLHSHLHADENELHSIRYKVLKDSTHNEQAMDESLKNSTEHTFQFQSFLCFWWAFFCSSVYFQNLYVAFSLVIYYSHSELIFFQRNEFQNDSQQVFFSEYLLHFVCLPLLWLHLWEFISKISEAHFYMSIKHYHTPSIYCMYAIHSSHFDVQVNL